MTEDEVLQKVSAKITDTIIWGNYTQHYDWEWVNGKPLLIPTSPTITAGVMIRDWAIAKKLKELGVKKVLDVGSDTGHFMAVLKSLGIDSVGIDPNKEICASINSKGINKCYPIGIESLLTTDIHDYDCITCMNITHATWKDESVKTKFITWIANHSTYAILSDFTHQDRSWKELTFLHDFNLLPFYCSPLVVKIAQKLNIEKVISYPGIQKLYKSTI